MKRVAALLPLLLLAGCGRPWWPGSRKIVASPSSRVVAPSGVTYELQSEVEERHGIRRYYVSRYRLLERDSSGNEREVWRDERVGEKASSHLVASDGTVWVGTEGVPGPGASGKVWMRRVGDSQAWVAPLAYVLQPRLTTIGGIPSRVFSGAGAPPNLSTGSTAHLRSGAEQLRLPVSAGREIRLTWLDANARSHHQPGSIPRWTVQEIPSGVSDLWTEALDSVSKAPQDADFLLSRPYATSPIRIWNSPKGLLAMRAPRNWQWDWPVRLESVTALKSMPLGWTGYDRGSLWFNLDPSVAPRLEMHDGEGKRVKSFDLSRYGYPDAGAVQSGLNVEDPLILTAWKQERTFRSVDPMREYVRPEEIRFAKKDGGRLVLILGGKNAPRLKQQSAAQTIALNSRKERPNTRGAMIDEKTLWSPSKAFRARLRHWPDSYGSGKPIFTLTLLGRRRVGGETIDVELSSRSGSGQGPLSVRLFDDGRMATYEEVDGKSFVSLFDLDGENIMSLDLLQPWYRDAKDLRRKFRLDQVAYKPEGAPIVRTVEGVSVRQQSQATIGLPGSSGPRVNIERGAEGPARVWWGSGAPARPASPL